MAAPLGSRKRCAGHPAAPVPQCNHYLPAVTKSPAGVTRCCRRFVAACSSRPLFGRLGVQDPLFGAHAGRYPARLQVGDVNHWALFLAVLGREHGLRAKMLVPLLHPERL